MRVSKAPKSEKFLGYVTFADLGKVVAGRGSRKKFPYNTRLDNGKGTIQSCCKCFKRPSRGACSAHHAATWLRLCAAEAALKEADKRVAALEDAVVRGADSQVLQKALNAVISLRHD